MNKPIFQCGAYDVRPEHPSDWSLPALKGIAKGRTLDGTEVKDLTWRKYQYTFTWDAMSKADFEALEELINYHNDAGVDISFSYEKFPQSAVAILVHCDPLDRTRTGGQGSEFYYQNVVIELVEVSSRV